MHKSVLKNAFDVNISNEAFLIILSTKRKLFYRVEHILFLIKLKKKKMSSQVGEFKVFRNLIKISKSVSPEPYISMRWESS